MEPNTSYYSVVSIFSANLSFQIAVRHHYVEVHYFGCFFMYGFQTMHYQLQKQSKTHGVGVHLLMIDRFVKICILFISFSKASYSVYVNELMFIVTKLIVCPNTVIFGDWFSYYQYHVDDFTAVLILYARYELHPESLLCTYIIVILMHRFGSQGSLSAEVNCLM